MYRTVHLECCGESYWWLVLVENINCYVCDCAEEIGTIYFVGWILCEYAEMDIKEIRLVNTRTENNFINTYTNYRLFSLDIW
jgi:hypothetical protein